MQEPTLAILFYFLFYFFYTQLYCFEIFVREFFFFLNACLFSI